MCFSCMNNQGEGKVKQTTVKTWQRISKSVTVNKRGERREEKRRKGEADNS